MYLVAQALRSNHIEQEKLLLERIIKLKLSQNQFQKPSRNIEAIILFHVRGHLIKLREIVESLGSNIPSDNQMESSI